MPSKKREVRYRLYVLRWNHEIHQPYYERVRDIHAKYPVPAMSAYADRHGYTRLVNDGTLWGGYLVNDSTGDSLHVIPADKRPEEIYPI